MKFLTAILILLSLQASADTCGLFQVEDYGQQIFYSLWTFGPTETNQRDYAVLNPQSAAVSQMLSGSCYCVEGPIYAGPKIVVSKITRGPYSGCVPEANMAY